MIDRTAEAPAPAWGRGSDQRGLRPVHAIALIVLTSFLFVAPALVLGPTMGAVDIVGQFAPYQEQFSEPRLSKTGLQGDQAIQLVLPAKFYRSLRNGDLQMWEPNIGGGTPMAPAVYNRLLSPLNWPYAVLPAPIASTVGVFMAMLLAQLGVYGLGRRLGLGVAGATLAAVGYAFSGPLTAFVLRFHETFLLPAWLFAIHGTVTDEARRWRFAALTAAATALLWFGGFPGIATMATYTAAAFSAFMLVASALEHSGRAARMRHLGWASAALLLAVGAGFAIAALQLLPTLEFLDSTLALERRYGHHHMTSAALAMAFSGRFFGAFQDGDWWWPELANVIESSSTMGMVLLGLLATLLLGVRSRASRRPERFLAAFALPAAIVLLQASYFGRPVLALLQRLPYLDQTAFPRFRFVPMLMLALVAGYGLDRLLQRDRDGERPGWLLRAELVYLPVILAIGGAHAIEAMRGRAVVRSVAVDLVVPITALLIAAAALWFSAARPAVTGGTPAARLQEVGAAVVILALAAELQWGALLLTPFSELDEFYPDNAAYDVLRDDVGPGGQYRYFDRPNLAAYGHTGVWLELSDALAHWPVYSAYQELIEQSDPDLAATTRHKAVFEPTFGGNADLGSPALDAISARWLVAALGEGPIEVGPPVPATEPLSGRLPLAVDVTVSVDSVRSMSAPPIVSSDPECTRGWVELRVGGHVTRRALRELAAVATFPLPDLDVDRGTEVTLSATDCPVTMAEVVLDAHPAAEGTDVELVSTLGWQAYRRPDALPRLALATATVSITAPDERLAFIAGRGPDGPVVLSDATAEREYRGGEARFVRDEADVVEVAVDSDGPGLLILRDSNAPGWSAHVDGRPVPLIDVDHAFRGVQVADGRSTVVFSYEPASWVTGQRLALGGLVLLAGLLTADLLGRRRTRPPARRHRRPPGRLAR